MNKDESVSGKITLDRDFFQLLLNCLANQKFTHELKEKNRQEMQQLIDETWCKGMTILYS